MSSTLFFVLCSHMGFICAYKRVMVCKSGKPSQKTELNLNLLNARKTVGQLIKFQGCNKNTNYSVITIDRK